MQTNRLTDLLLQSLEHERGSARIYDAAARCALDQRLQTELAKHLEETHEHAARLTELIAAFGIDPDAQTPGRNTVARLGQWLLDTIRAAAEQGPPETAELVACECVALAQSKAYLDGVLAGHPGGARSNRAMIPLATSSTRSTPDSHTEDHGGHSTTT